MSNYVTQEGLVELQNRYQQIKEVELPKVLESLTTARQDGDLRENASYQTAMKMKDDLEAEISELEGILKDYEIIEEDVAATKSKSIQLGSKLKIQYLADNSIHDVRIVGSSEANVIDGKISNESPLAECIMGKKVGFVGEFRIPQGKVKISVKVLEIL